MHTGNHANVHSHHLSPLQLIPAPTEAMYCMEDALASVGQIHAVLWGKGGKMSRKTPQNPAFSSASYWSAPGLVVYWGKIQPRTEALNLCWGLHLEKDTLEAKDFPSPKYL